MICGHLRIQFRISQGTCADAAGHSEKMSETVKAKVTINHHERRSIHIYICVC